MADKLSVYSLGVSGVIIDQSPLEPTLPPDALMIAQNVIHDPKSGHGGGLRNRNGLAKFNPTTLGGPILGGAPMIAVGTAGAPAPSPTGPTGTPTGPAGGAPGDPGPGTGGGGGGGAGVFPDIPSGTPGLIIGRAGGDPSGASDDGWFVTTPDIATTGILVATPGPPGEMSRSIPIFPGWTASPGCAVVGGYLYYPGWHSQATNGTAGDVSVTPGVVPPTLRRTNGLVDEFVCAVLKNGLLIDDPTNINYSYGYRLTVPQHLDYVGAQVQPCICSLVAVNDNTIFFSVLDVGQTAGTEIGNTGLGTSDVARLFRFTVADGHLTQIPLSAPTDVWHVLPFALAWWNDEIWFGGIDSGGASLYHINPNVALDLPHIKHYIVAPAFRVTTLCAFGGYLFAGLQMRASSAPGYAVIYRYSADPVAPPDVSYSNTSGDGLAQTNNAIVSIVEFQGTLFASLFNSGLSTTIIKYDPVAGTWSTVFTVFPGAYALTLIVDAGTLYAFGPDYIRSTWAAYVSTDGVTFTDKTATLGITSSNTPLPILFSFTG